MDLLTYAVKSKLINAEDPLLAYVAKRIDVPVSILEESFKELLEPLEDEKSSLLVEDYPKMLEKYVAVQYTRNQPDGSYEVSGEIPSQLLEAINLVHGESQEDIISELVSKSTKQITNRSVEVEKLSLTELDARMSDLVNDMPEIKQVDDVEEFVEEVVEEIFEDENFEEAPIEEEQYEEEQYEEEQYEEEQYEEEQYEEEQYEEEQYEEEQYEDENIEEEQYEEGQEVVNNMTEEEYSKLENRLLTEGIQRVYDKILEDLREKGLVESLGLSV